MIERYTYPPFLIAILFILVLMIGLFGVSIGMFLTIMSIIFAECFWRLMELFIR